MWAAGAGFAVAVLLIVIAFAAAPPIAPLGFILFFIDVCFLACVNHKITNTVRMMLLTASTYENQVYRDRVPPVRWIVDEWELVTTTVATGGRHGPRTSRSSRTFFDLYVEVGSAAGPQMIVHQHVYGATPMPQYGQPPVGYAPPNAYAQQYAAPPAGYLPQGQMGYPPAGFPPQQWSPIHAPPPSQPYYGQPPAAQQRWAPQPTAPAYSEEPAVTTYNNETTSSSLLSGAEQSDT